MALILAIGIAINRTDLWRDEIQSLNMTTRSWSEMWSSLRVDTFPPGFTIIAKPWISIFGSDTISLRTLVAVLMTFCLGWCWWITWRWSRHPPIFAILLIGLLPYSTVALMNFRPHILDVLTVLILVGCLWELLRQPSWRWAMVTGLAFSASGYASYPNFALSSVVLLITAAFLLGQKNKRVRVIVLMIWLGGLVTSAPLWPIVRSIRNWSFFMSDITASWPSRLAEIINSQELTYLFVLLIGGLSLILWRILRVRQLIDEDKLHRLVCLAVIICVGYLAVDIATRLVTHESAFRYYLPLFGLGAIFVDLLLIEMGPLVNSARGMVAIIAWSSMAVTAWLLVLTPMTNVPTTVRAMTPLIQSHDVILVNPWYLGTAIKHADAGNQPIVTFPPVSDLSLARFDLVQNSWHDPAALNYVYNLVHLTLTTHGTVWYISYVLPLPPADSATPPRKTAGENVSNRQAFWGQDLEGFLLVHAGQKQLQPFPGMNDGLDENIKVTKLADWID